MASMTKQSFDEPKASQQPAAKIKMDELEIDGHILRRVTAAPGWKWSVDLKPVTGTDSCPIDHLLYMQSGTMHVVMDDGTELDFVAGDYAHIPPGHDGWGTGDEPTVWLELAH